MRIYKSQLEISSHPLLFNATQNQPPTQPPKEQTRNLLNFYIRLMIKYSLQTQVEQILLNQTGAFIKYPEVFLNSNSRTLVYIHFFLSVLFNHSLINYNIKSYIFFKLYYQICSFCYYYYMCICTDSILYIYMFIYPTITITITESPIINNLFLTSSLLSYPPISLLSLLSLNSICLLIPNTKYEI